jgi:CBS domain-containing protein
MRARDVMSTSVMTLPPDAPLATAAGMLAKRGVSGAPVVDGEGKLLGMVTETDLLRRLAAVEDRPRSWVAGLFASAQDQADRFARTHGRRARDVMTTQLETVAPETSVEHVARVLEEKKIRRVPVVEDGKLVGLVSRADLLRALLVEPGTAKADAPDERIRRDLQQAMREQPWVDTYFLFPEVKDGVVTYYGFCRSDAVKRALRVLAEGVPGVKDVKMETEAMPLFASGE